MDSNRAIIHAVCGGVGFIDTAAIYGLGHAERLVGSALRQIAPEQRPYVFTKGGLVWDEATEAAMPVLDGAALRRHCDASLKRLGIERLDLFQIHRPPTDDTLIDDAWLTLAELVSEGKTRWIGASNFTVEQLERCEAIRHVDAIQVELSLISRSAANDVIPWAGEHGVGVLAYSPLASGLLTGTITRERVRSLEDTDRRTRSSLLKEPALSHLLDFTSGLRGVADRVGCSVPALAIAWTLSVNGVSAAIVGARSPIQIEGWLGAADIRLSERDLAEIEDLADGFRSR